MKKRMDVYYVKENISIMQFLRIVANGASEFFGGIAESIMSVIMNLFLLMYFAGPYLAGVFIKPGQTDLMEMSVTAVKIFAFSYLTGWIDTCFSSLFTALDRPGRSLISAVFGTLIFPVAFLFILTPVWGLNGVWLMASVSGLASGVLTLVLIKTLSAEND